MGLVGQSEAVAEAALALARGELGTARLIGGGQAGPRAAALANGAVSHALDYDDTHFLHIGHPSVAVIPTACAIAETRGTDGKALLDALALGLETACRVGDWLGRSTSDLLVLERRPRRPSHTASLSLSQTFSGIGRPRKVSGPSGLSGAVSMRSSVHMSWRACWPLCQVVRSRN